MKIFTSKEEALMDRIAELEIEVERLKASLKSAVEYGVEKCKSETDLIIENEKLKDTENYIKYGTENE